MRRSEITHETQAATKSRLRKSDGDCWLETLLAFCPVKFIVVHFYYTMEKADICTVDNKKKSTHKKNLM